MDVRKYAQSIMLVASVVMSLGQFLSGQNANPLKEPDFPKTEEIQLAVAQSERAFQQYKNALDMEAQLPSLKSEDIADDRKTLEAAMKILERLKANPDAFHGSLGLLLLSSLDDGSRNAVVCANAGNTEIVVRLAAGRHMNDKTISAISDIVAACGYASAQLNTVSENVHALMVREMDALALQNQQTMSVLEKCAAQISKQPQK